MNRARACMATLAGAILAAATANAAAQASDGATAGMRILPTETIGSTDPTPEAPAIARREAYAALSEAQRDCRRQPSGDAGRDCMQQAHDDFEQQMAQANHGS